jgi:hypothetical protein
MINLRNTLAIALTTAALGLGALSMSTPAEAHSVHEMGGHGREMGFNGDRGFGHHNHCDVWGASCNRGGGGHGWGYGWGHRYGYFGYGYSPVVVEEAPICPPGTHPSYRHDLCVPNDR